VPSSSMVITWSTYIFTLTFMFAYAVAGLRLVNSVSRMRWSDWKNGDNGFWMTYECALLVVVLCTAFAVAGRWRLMDSASEQYATAREMVFVASVTAMCQAHEHLVTLASMTAAMTLFRAYRLVTYATHVSSNFNWTLGESSYPLATAGAYALIVAYGAWHGSGGSRGLYGFINAVVLGRQPFDVGVQLHRRLSPLAIGTAVVVHLLFNTAVISVIIKHYVVTRMYSRQR